jgi:TolB protein
MKCGRQLLLALALATLAGVSTRGQIGTFEDEADVGAPGKAGKALFDAANATYTISGGGSNMWFSSDAFHFVWKKVSGDVSLAADILVNATQGGDPHRKGVLMVRQSLDADSAYADAALHGDGLTSLQYRESKGARTYEIQANAKAPKRLRIEKRGKYVSMSIAGEGEELHPAGGSFRLELQEPFYIGLGVCAHNNDRIESAVFSKVDFQKEKSGTNLLSTLETITIASKDRRVVWTTTNRIEAPNWMKDGTNLLFNGRGRIYRISATGGDPAMVETGLANRCNNDHGLSPDGKTLVISDQSQTIGASHPSLIYTLPLSGGAPKRITERGPSYWHGWSPDGKWLAFCGQRNNEFDIYTISVDGGEEKRLTTSKGLDDGPDYTADGKYIYFNSERSGQMQVWRMKPDGSDQEQVINDEFNNWFPHPSPDGKWLVFLSFEKEVTGHPEDKDVTLRIIPLAGGKIEVLAKLFGGQGTINVPSWSPDSRRLAFVSYQRRP